MAWTQADIDKLRAAILALASGEAVQTVSYNGPPARTVTYRAPQLDEMRSLLSSMQQELNRAAGKKGYTVAAFKGQ
jgi:hypothetical protein